MQMKASDMIQELQYIVREYGDSEVYAHHEDENVIDTVMPCDDKIVLSQW
jgi:hypothetical protein